VTIERTGFIPIPQGMKPGFDHADIWLGDDGARMFVAHTGADRVDVIDCGARAFLRSIGDLPGVAGVLVDHSHDLLFTSDRGCARVSVFRCSDESLLGQVEVGQHPNGLAYDPTRRHLFSFNLGEPLGVGCTSSVVDVDSMTVVAEIGLPGRPRWAAYDSASDTVFANVLDPAVVLRIDPAALSIRGSIDVPAAGPHGLWVDGERLYCAADGGALVVIDRDSGGVTASLSLPGAPDVVWHDPMGGELYVAVGDPGSVTVVDTSALEVVESIATEDGAHTLCWDPIHETLYVFCPGSGGAALFTRQGGRS
jgi:DNA-binding beta-propeller fold protein YncE